MFLKRIEIVGFKSFADKTTLDFSPGITAVVGPNGSGKSNIADAIRWVLGEQSARNLRGSKMEDVIFAGSESRRSINFCEVSLTLDNEDKHLPVVFEEVTVTRRVYRSGESEYLINRQTCRLKDIHELFMDSGLGRESYSIIGQGKIEEMLSTRPEERRGPFEDAAGIVKYKFRRKDAERKLEETAANLLRVDDILAELERQAGPLEMEAKKAKEYKVLADTLYSFDITLLVHQIDQLKMRWEQSVQSVDALALQRQQSIVEVAEVDARLRSLRMELESKSTELETIQEQYVEAVEERQKSEGTKALLEERIENGKKSIKDRQQQQYQIQNELSEIDTHFHQLNQRVCEVELKLELQSLELEKVMHSVNPERKSVLEKELEQLNVDLIERHHEAATYRNEIKSAEEVLETDARKQERYESEQAKWQSAISAHQEVIAALRLQIDAKKERITLIQEDIAKVTTQYREGVEKEAHSVGVIHKLQSELASLSSRLDLLKDLEDGYDGYALGVKTVMQASTKGRLHGIHGSVAALLTVPKQFELAMETALGGALQNIVVQTEKDARAAIVMLKQRQAGRATFMPVEVIRSRLLSDIERQKVEQVHGFVGIASELVHTQPEFQMILEHLLGNVIIATTLADANNLARMLNYKIRIVTLDGDVVSPGGIMSGGSQARKGPGLLGRTRERNELQRICEEKQEEMQKLLDMQKEIRTQVQEWQQAGQALSDELRHLESESTRCTSAFREEEVKRQATEERLAAIQWEWEQVQSGSSEVLERLTFSQQKLVSVTESIANLENQIREKRQVIEAWEASSAALQEQLTVLRVDVATLNQERTLMHGQSNELAGRKARLMDRFKQLLQEQEQFATLQQETQMDLERAVQRIGEMHLLTGEMESALALLRQERFQIELSVAEVEKQSRAHHLSLTQLEERVHRAEVAMERADAELNHALMKMGENFQMTYEWAKEHYPAIGDMDRVRMEADVLRRQMQALGPVQLGAIEEWDRLYERIHFLQTQRDDLLQAEVQLRQVIAEIDDEMSRRFLETFEQIQQEFRVAFRALFNGGNADLQLTDAVHPLTTGIEVIAQPPGKKLQNLNLMSGGERALTAMALLFAILRVRPVPFCVLDEVEAALDEANVSRFASQLRTFADETQFIVITHRRGTMEEADVLYGVTMQEFGISSLISVRISDAMDVETA